MSANRDPIAFELFKNAIFSIADEMALTVLRTTYSGVLKDNMDYSTGFADASGRLVAQGLTLPGHLGSVPTALESIMRHYGDDMADGDVFIMNDPFDGGMHLPDIFVFKPLYIDGERLAFACTVCHHTDVGGRVAGSNASDSTEIYAEGLRIPPLKFYAAGKRNETLVALIEKNVRLPVKVLGDLRAQLAACHIAEKQFRELVAKYGPEQTRLHMQETIDYAERLTRAALEKLPDGAVELRGLDRRRRHRLRQADPAVRDAEEERRPHGRRLDRHASAGQRRDQQHAVLHESGLLYGRALGAAAGHPEQRRRVSSDRGDLPAGHGRQRRAAGGLRGPRAHRLPHDGLHVRGAGDDAPRQGQGGRRRRQHRRVDRRVLPRTARRSSTSTSPAAPGARGPGRTVSTATRTCSRTWPRIRSK